MGIASAQGSSSRGVTALAGLEPASAALLENCRRGARLAGVIGFVVGFVVLAGGWGCDIDALRTALPGYSEMVPNTALAILLFGLALWMDQNAAPSRMQLLIGPVLVGVTFAIGVVTLSEYALAKDLGVDELLFKSRLHNVTPGRMAVMTATTFVALSSAMFLSRERRLFAAGQFLVLPAGVLCLFNMFGFLYGVKSFYALAFLRTSTAMAIHTSVALVILCIGVLLSRPAWGLMSTVTSLAPGGVMVRRLLPAALLVPGVGGWLRWQGEKLGLYDTAFGLALFTQINIATFGFLVWRCGQILNKLDVQRARAEEILWELSNSMPQIVWTAGASGVPDYYNQRCYEYLGMGFERTRDGGWVAAIHPDDVETVMAKRVKHLAASESYSLEYRFRRHVDGMYRWHLGQGIPILNADGETVRWIGTCSDIHSFKVAEEALRTSELYFRQLADSMPQIVWTSTPDGNLDYYNQRWHEYTGLDFQQTKDWGWRQVLHPDDLANCEEKWTRSFLHCEPYQVEYRFLRAADGVYRWHLGRAQPIRDASGMIVRWFGTCTDIEDYKRVENEIRVLNDGLEERVRERTGQLDRSNRDLARANDDLRDLAFRLEQSNRELQEFASVASHDLQEPLRKVQAFGDRLKASLGAAMDPQAGDYLERMMGATKRMQTLVKDLLTLSRVTRGAQPFLPVDLGLIANEAITELELRIAESHAEVHVGKLPIIYADAMQIRQLLFNLIGNALKFHRKDVAPRVSVYTEMESGEGAEGILQIVVKDEGIGFEEKYLDRIFGMFQRLHGRSEYEGTGIGLAICRKIAQRHGGDITAKSTLGEGSTFLIKLPLHCLTANNLPIPSAPTDKQNNGRNAVLASAEGGRL